jgi:phage repressor protein C with HTH and peptisase S24 domain
MEMVNYCHGEYSLRMTTERRPLEDWEKAECAALKAELQAFNARSPKEKRLTQEEVAHSLRMSQGTLSSHLNGHRAINLDMAAQMARLLDIPVERFSKRLASEIGELSKVPTTKSAVSASEGAASKVLDMLRKHSGKKLDDSAQSKIMAAVTQTLQDEQKNNVIQADFSGLRPRSSEILIPQYDIRAAMGDGQVPADYNEAIRNLVVREDLLREKGVSYTSNSALAMVTGWGQSMEGTIEDKDPVIVDRGVTEYIGEGVYLLIWHGELFIKRIQRQDEDHLWLISDNKNYAKQSARLDDVTIKAKVLMVWNARKV